jgi:UBX domain-containing protein 1
MVVQGPNKKGHSLVDDILKKAEEGGTYEEEEEEEMDTIRKKPKYYTGTGYRLGSEDEPSSQSIINQEEEEEEEELEPAIRHLTFWRNGFSVDDGPLYEYSNPVNQHLLTAIHSGRAPLSLLDVQHGQPVEVRVIKRQEEDYIPPPKAPPKPFEGTGHRLGSEPTTPVTESTSAPSSIPSIAVDQTQPVTSIQIRLGDGSR